ncbi:MAG: hypothetical protein H6585_05120 [Flavobacteriales bacterium]|nr:hypothetical protein [Flavobacteriales bacterium]
MNRILHILLAFMVLTSTMGVTIGTHYCHGKAVNRSLVITGPQEPCCGMAGCCKNTFQYNKVAAASFQVNDHTEISFPSFITHSLANAGTLLPFANHTCPDHSRFGAFTKPPPPCTVGHKLALLQTYLI